MKLGFAEWELLPTAGLFLQHGSKPVGIVATADDIEALA